jgi:hypothetical protein
VSQAPGADPREAAPLDFPVADPDVPAASPAAAPGDAPPANASPADAPGEAVPSSPDPRVDDALSRLAEIEALPLAEQVQVYTDIHRRLAGVLADPDSQA